MVDRKVIEEILDCQENLYFFLELHTKVFCVLFCCSGKYKLLMFE